MSIPAPVRSKWILAVAGLTIAVAGVGGCDGTTEKRVEETFDADPIKPHKLPLDEKQAPSDDALALKPRLPEARTVRTVASPASELGDEAAEAAKEGNFARAYKLCVDALELKPSLPKARMVCTIASCKMKNAKRAKKHYGRLSDSAKRAVKGLCYSSGVDLE
jgi:hypothetical protein